MALVLAAVALYFRPAIIEALPGGVADDVALAGSDIAMWGGGDPLTGDPGDTRGIWPPVPADARKEPLGTPPPSASNSTEFAFMATIPERGGDRPVAWDPCRPIHLVVNSAAAPPGADRLLREALDSVSAATGLKFVIEGASTEAPTTPRAPLERSRYGNRWSPVLVAWTDPAAVPELQGPVAGIAGPASAPFYTPAQQHWVSGTVYLDGPQLREILLTEDGVAVARAIVMHELGHLVGLHHVSAPDQLMYEQNIDQRDFAVGDREGLRQLGLGRCFTG